MKKFDEGKKHNMLAIMFDTRFQNLEGLVSTLIGHDQGVAIIKQYDTMSL